MDINIAEIEFSQIKENLKAYLSTKDEFTDYNFEGSAISYLIDMLSFLIHYNGYHLNMSVNEMFLSSATIRKNINAIAKSLNYIPRRKTGSEAIVTISLKEEFIPEISSTIVISKYTDFLSTTCHFFSNDEYVLDISNGYSFESAILRQGVYNDVTYISTGLANQFFTIENDSIDNNTLEVYVNGSLWTLENNLTVLDETSETYSIEITEDDYVKIIFGDDIIGKIPEVSSEILILYTETVGSEGNDYNTFSLNEVIIDDHSVSYDNSKFIITVTEIASGGGDWETLNSIKINAPKFYSSQGRLITKDDYISYLSSHPLVESINVWGGEDELPDPVYGRVYICIKPPNADALTINQKNTITSYIDSKNILTLTLEYKDPIFIYVNISGTIYFYQQYEAQLSTIRNEVETAISDYFDSLDDFDSIFKNAKFITALNDLEKVSNTIITISPFFYFSKSSTNNYYFVLDNVLIESSIDCTIGEIEGFYDDGEGNIKNKVNDETIGSIDYENGTIEIFPGYEIAGEEPENGFTCYFSTYNDDIEYKRNRMLKYNEISLSYVRGS